MALVGGAEHQLSVLSLRYFEDRFYLNESERLGLAVHQRQPSGGAQFGRDALRDVQQDRHGPRRTSLQCPLLDDATVVGFPEEAAQRAVGPDRGVQGIRRRAAIYGKP